MIVKPVEKTDKEFVMSIDKHVTDTTFENRVLTKSGYVFWEGSAPIGMLFHCVLWDNLPFLNFIFIDEEFRNRGYGSEAITYWEKDMKQQGYKMVLVSTQVDESAQFLYRKLGYVDCGGLLFNNTPMEQPMEMFLRKIL